MVLLGWDANYMVVLYYAESLALFAALFVVMATEFDDLPQGTWPGQEQAPVTPSRVAHFVLAALIVIGLFAIVTGIPVARAWREIDPHQAQFIAALVLQLAAAATAVPSMRRQVRAARRRDRDYVVYQQGRVITGRWLVAAFLVGAFVPYAWAVVAAYAGATAWLELRPPAPQRTILPPD